MKTAIFVKKFACLVVAVLSCYDRIIFKGYLPFRNGKILERFVDYELKMRRKGFMLFAEKKSNYLVSYTKDLAEQTAGAYRFLNGSHDKDQLVAQLIGEHRIREALICVLCCMEICRSFRLNYGKGRPRLRSEPRQQRVLYYYYLDPEFDRMHVRLETWFAFTIQIAVNAHQFLARQMQKKKLGFCLRDNGFTELDQPKQAQKLADRFVQLQWHRLLSRLAHRVNPLLKQGWFKHWNRYYWVTDQTEYATDLLFGELRRGSKMARATQHGR